MDTACYGKNVNQADLPNPYIVILDFQNESSDLVDRFRRNLPVLNQVKRSNYRPLALFLFSQSARELGVTRAVSKL